MIVRKTGAKKGQSPVWYVQADDEVERALFASEIVLDQSPDARYTDALAWGFGSKAAAEAAAEGLEQALGSLPVDVLGAREQAIAADAGVALVELRAVVARLDDVAGQMHDVRLNEIARTLNRLVDRLAAVLE